MSEFSPTDAALEGLRITRERPKAVLWWWAAGAAYMLVQGLLSFLPAFHRLDVVLPDILAAYQTALASPTDPAAAQRFYRLLGPVAPAFATLSALNLLVQMVLSTAVLRAVLRPADRAFGYLRLSLDEIRQLGLALLIFAAFLAYAFLVTIASSLVFGGLALLIPGAGAVLALLAIVAVVTAFLYPTVRLSLSPALTFADGRISFLRTWSLTEGRFWPLLGAYVVSLAIAAVLFVAISLPVFLALKLVGWLADLSSQAGGVALVKPGYLVGLIVNSLLGALIGAIVTAPIASAYRQITGRVGAAPAAPVAAGSPWG